jgi:hypothetical protein
MEQPPQFCGRCGARIAAGSPFCGRCGTPQLVQGVAPAPVYSYPMAHRAAYPAMARPKLSQTAIAIVLVAILAVVTIAVTAFAVSRAFGGGAKAKCTANCAPKIVTALPEASTFHSATYSFEVDYNSNWTVRKQDGAGVVFGTRLGTLQVAGIKAGQSLDQVIQATVSSLPSAQWQAVTRVSDLKGAHIGDQDGLGGVYSANLVGGTSTASKVRFAVIAATRGGVTVVIFAVDPADLKSSPNGIPEGQEFDYLCTEFRWS